MSNGIVRLACDEDLPSLLELFAASDVSAAVHSKERAEDIWCQTLASPHIAVFVADSDGVIVATAMLITAPNLLRGGLRHGFLENVMTHPAWQGRGWGKRVVGAALAHGWQTGCHHILMQSGRADPRVHQFYESLGFIPGLRTAYVARRPSHPGHP